MSPPTRPLGRLRARRSLRQKLPLLVSALTGGALLIAVSLAYLEVRSAARAAADLRIRNVAVQLVDLVTPGLQERAELEEELARAPAISRALSGGVIDSVRVDSLLSELRGGSDGDLPVMLVASDGSPVFSIGAPVSAPDAFAEPPLDSLPHDGFFRQVGDRMLYWRTFPVRSTDGEMLGWIAQRRRLGSPQTGQVIESLVGSGVRIALGQVSDSVWVDLGGNRVARGPTTFIADEPFTYDAGGEGEVLAMVGPLESSPWVLLVQMPMSEVMARPRSFLSRAVAAGLALLFATMVIAWLASRRLTGPLQEMAHAAGRIAEGDYDRRVEPRGGDELALLATAFNTMAEQVARSDEALRHQLEEERALALRLEAAKVEAESAREEAQAASRAKSEFLATMSHEIRTPINAVIGYTSLLEGGIPDPPTDRQRDYLKRIERSSRLLISLVNDVLDLARIESGRLHLEVGIGSAEEAVLSAVAALEPEADRKGIRLEHRCEEGAAFKGDPQRVQQILLNLLSNAVKFTREGGSVRVSCELVREGPPGEAPRPGRWLRVDVEDTGIGIERDQLGSIFQPFVQANVGFTREHGGAGLGLPISRRLARMMAGDVSVESVPGEGSRFTLWLEGHSEGGRAAAAG